MNVVKADQKSYRWTHWLSDIRIDAQTNCPINSYCSVLSFDGSNKSVMWERGRCRRVEDMVCVLLLSQEILR